MKVAKTEGKALDYDATNNSEDKLFFEQISIATEGEPHWQTEASEYDAHRWKKLKHFLVTATSL